MSFAPGASRARVLNAVREERSTRRRARVALAVVTLAFASACGAPRIRIERSRPAAFQLSQSQRIVVTAAPDGSEPAAETVMMAALTATQGQLLNKFVAVVPVQTAFVDALQSAQYSLGEAPSADLMLRLVPVRWVYEIDSLEDVTAGRGKLEVRLQILNAREPGAPALYDETYWGTATSRGLGEPEAMSRAAQNIATRFLEDLQPGRVWDEVELDDGDPAVKPGIRLCRQGRFDEAYVAFSDVVARNPASAPALYNLAVLAESRGRYDDAEWVLKKAIGIQPRDLYQQALARVRVARRDWESLQQQSE